MVEHTCTLDELEPSQMNITSAFIVNVMYVQIVNNLNYELGSTIRQIEEDYKYTISYNKAWRAKRKAIEMRFRTYEESYDNLPHLLQTIARRNPRMYYDIDKYALLSKPSKYVLKRCFFALGACIEAFKHRRHILCIDSTFLTGKYTRQILTAIGVDGNNQVLPLTFAFVESENTSS